MPRSERAAVLLLAAIRCERDADDRDVIAAAWERGAFEPGQGYSTCRLHARRAATAAEIYRAFAAFYRAEFKAAEAQEVRA